MFVVVVVDRLNFDVVVLGYGGGAYKKFLKKKK
jgi:hypothetical protein